MCRIILVHPVSAATRGGLSFLVMLAVVFVGTAAASAQPSPAAVAERPRAAPSEEPAPAALGLSLAEAKVAQDKAAELFREDQFTAAAELLRQAYLGDSRPILLFNAGQAYRKAERALEAKAMYEKFLAAAPEHPLGPETRGYIKDMELFIAMQARAKEVALNLEEQLVATQTSEKQAARRLEEERLRSQQIRQALLQTQTQLERDRKKLVSRRRWILGLGIGSSLAVAAIVGVTVGLISNARASTDGGTALIAK